MLKKILIGLAVIVVGVLAVALLQSPDFRVERSIVIAAPAEKVFPYLSLFMSCERMCGPEFEKGLADVAQLVAKP